MSAVGVQYGEFNLEEALLVSPTGNVTDLKRDLL